MWKEPSAGIALAAAAGHAPPDSPGDPIAAPGADLGQVASSRLPQPAVVATVEPDSIAEELGFQPGDRLLSLNGIRPRDLIDFQLLQGEEALVLEVVTGNGYVPDLELSPQRHLQQLERGFSACRALQPMQVSVITGSDSWGWREQEPFWRQALALAEASGLPVSFETHRSRSLADPWRIERWLEMFP